LIWFAVAEEYGRVIHADQSMGAFGLVCVVFRVGSKGSQNGTLASSTDKQGSSSSLFEPHLHQIAHFTAARLASRLVKSNQPGVESGGGVESRRRRADNKPSKKTGRSLSLSLTSTCLLLVPDEFDSSIMH
jgi:hypothetical protein